MNSLFEMGKANVSLIDTQHTNYACTIRGYAKCTYC